MFTKVAMLAMAAIVFLQGCSGSGALPPDERIDGVVRILMHEPGHYTVLVQKSAASVISERELATGRTRDRGDVIYVPDVPNDRPMWLSTHSKMSESPSCHCLVTDIVFHIHDVGDIEGAGWDHGKFGRGRTSVIQ